VIWFILGIIVVLGGIVASLVTSRIGIAIGAVVLGVVLFFFSAMYTQEVGESLVVKNADGTIARVDTTAGMELKAPWQDTISFDTKGQQALFKGNGQGTSEGEQVDRPEVTVSTSDKVASNLDIAVRYSLQDDKVGQIYTDYKTESVFFQRLISQDISTVVKDTAGKYTIDSLLADRSKYAKDIEDNLKKRWEGKGVIVENVALQTIRPPASITDRITKSQEAQQQLVTTQAATKVKEEEAKQKRIEAQGEADANRIKNNALSDRILQEKYIDSLKNAKNLIVVPEGSTPMIQTK
jgi:regulator of protease activity HflC (stomatin/prohibitin superfamily)